MFDNHSDRDMSGVVVPLGATPHGVAKLVNPNARADVLSIQLQILDGRVIVDFGQPVRWIGLSPDEAGKLAADLEVAVRYARTVHAEGL